MIDSIAVIINDMQNHAQGIAHEVNRIETFYNAAADKQDNASYLRMLYKASLTNLEALIAIEEQLYKHAEYLRSTAGISAADGKSPAFRPDEHRKSRGGC